MANPYMRDELLDEMDQSVNTKKPVGAPVPLATPGTPPVSPEVSTVQPPASTSPSGVGVNGLEPQPTPTNPTSPDNPNATPVTPPVTPPATPAVAGGPQRYAGFDTQRAQDPTKSAKDSFYRATQSAPTMPQDKAGSEAWFNQYIKSKLEADGYKVDWVKGDKAFVRTRENPQGEEIDFNQGADSDASSVAWQSNMAGQTTGGATGGTGATGGGASLSPALTDPNVLTNITKQIETLMGAGLSLDDIMKMLSGEQPSPTTTDTGAGA